MLQQDQSLLKSGKYEFYITGIISTDRDGNHLKMRDGGTYQKLKLSVVDRDGYNKSIYDPIFGDASSKIEQIIKSIGSEILMQKFKSGNLLLQDLIGTGGYCIVGVREGKDNYPAQNNVECYLQKHYGALTHNSSEGDKWKTDIKNEVTSTTSNVENLEPVFDISDDIPF